MYTFVYIISSRSSMQLSYIEDCMGGIVCYKNQKNYFLSMNDSSKICFEGTREEMEVYLGCQITEDNISYIACCEYKDNLKDECKENFYSLK